MRKRIGVEPDRTTRIEVGEREGLERDRGRAGWIEANGLGLNFLPVQLEHDGSVGPRLPLTAHHTSRCRHAFLAGEELSPEGHRRHGGVGRLVIGNRHGIHYRSRRKCHTFVAIPTGALEVADDEDLTVRELGLFEDRLGQLQCRTVKSPVCAQTGRVHSREQAAPIRGRTKKRLRAPSHEYEAGPIGSVQPLEDLSSFSLRPLPAVSIAHRVRSVQYDDDFARAERRADRHLIVFKEGTGERGHE